MAHLVLSQRYEIYHLQKQGASFTSIAKSIGVHKSTVSRELKRNSDSRNNVYKVTLAQKKSKDGILPSQNQNVLPKKLRISLYTG